MATEEIELKTARDAILHNCAAFLDEYLARQRKDEALPQFFSQYDYTVDAYIDELKNAATAGLRAGFRMAAKRANLNVPRNKALEKEWTDFLIWWLKYKMNAINFKWFSVEREPQGSIECALLNAQPEAKVPSNFFNKLSHRAFELYRAAKSGPYAEHIRGELPILFFGNLKEYLYSDIRILTLGRAPSLNEVTAGTARFRESETDYSTMFLPMPRPWETNQYLGVCNGYFKRTPNWDYFQHFNPLLKELLASYICEKNRNAIIRNLRKCRREGLIPMELPLNIAVHFNYCTPLVLDNPWDAFNESEQKAFSLEEAFPEILKALAPDIILCDFDIKETFLAEGANETTIPADWELSERYRGTTAYLRGKSQYILVLD
ncbi:MAG: hypothetical protein IJS08_00415 [Victivallales bacterium]|nr:hypothetical protein [Victivallales bacterium]